MTQSLLRLLFVLALFQIGFICCAEKQEKADIIAGGPIMRLPESVVNEIVEFVGAKNNLWKAHSYFKRVMVDCFPIHRFVAKIMNIPELADYSGIKSEILDLLNVPEFDCMAEKEQYFMNAILRQGKYQSIKNTLFKVSFDLIGRIGGNYIEFRLDALLRVCLHHGDLDVIREALKLLKSDEATSFMNHLFLKWAPERLEEIFKQLINHPDGKVIVGELIHFGDPDVLISLLIKHNVPESWWAFAKAFDELVPVFLNFAFHYAYPLRHQEFQCFETIFKRSSELDYVTDMYAIMRKDEDLFAAISSLTHKLRLNRPSYHLSSFLEFSITFDAMELEGMLLDLDSNTMETEKLIDSLFTTKIHNHFDEIVHSFKTDEIDDYVTVKIVKFFLLKSANFVKRNEWRRFELFPIKLMSAVFKLYEMEKACNYEYLDCLEFSGRLIDRKYADILPEMVTFYVPRNRVVLESILMTINTRKHEDLQFLMEHAEVCKFGNWTSPPATFSASVFGAIQESEEFHKTFLRWKDDGKGDGLKWALSPGDVEVFNRPIDRLIDVVYIDVTRGPFNLKTKEQFERFLQLYAHNINVDGKEIVLTVYKTLLSEEEGVLNNDGAEAEISKLFAFYFKFENFFRLWILSDDHWELLSFIDEIKIYDYLKIDFPIKIEKIRLLKCNRENKINK